MEEAYQKPIPRPSPVSAPFWRGCREHILPLQRCTRCGAYQLPPTVLCAECLSLDLEWVRASGKGKVFSFVIFHRVYHKGFANEVPYAVAVVALQEGPRMLTNLIDCPLDQIKCEMPVEVVFEDITDDLSLPKFRPVG